jgi:ATP phosphoribosyltransferase
VKRGVYFTPGNEVKGTEILRIGIPYKGRGQTPTWKLLEQCKLLPAFSEENGILPKSLDENIRIVALKQRDIPLDVAKGIIDVGIVGEDMVAESRVIVDVVSKLGYCRCRICLIGPADAPSCLSAMSGKVIATKLPKITEYFLKREGMTAEIMERAGALETAIKQGISSYIVDQVQTGRTLSQFDLKEISTIMESQFVMIANRESMKRMRNQIMSLKSIVEGVIAAENKRLVIFNISAENLDKVLDKLPSAKSPTVSPLANNKGFAVSIVVPDSQLYSTMAMILDAGGDDILASDISIAVSKPPSVQPMEKLYRVVMDRKTNPRPNSTTAKYLADRELLKSKFLEECGELANAVKDGKRDGKDGIVWEAADSLYFFLLVAAESSEFVNIDLNAQPSERFEKEGFVMEDFLDTSGKLVETLDTCKEYLEIGKRGMERGTRLCNTERNRLMAAYECDISDLSTLLCIWLASWRYILEQNGTPEEMVDFENERRNK